jgi:hypothetical protein
MKRGKIIPIIVILVAVVLFCFRYSICDVRYNVIIPHEPVIEPDYSGVTVPYNIAPMNFCILEDGSSYIIRCISGDGKQIMSVKSSDGAVRLPQKSWRKLLTDNQGKTIRFEIFSKTKNGELRKYYPISINISNESVDPYLCYRLLYPGFESWSGMQIVQRSLEDFSESDIFVNQLLDDNCVNCHTFLNHNPSKFLLHVRGSREGTYFVDGNEVKRRNLRVGKMIANAVYPAWHPDGRYIVFSSNEVVQVVHMIPGKMTEVLDQSSMLVMYDSSTDRISEIEEKDTIKYIETFPSWSPEGNYLYYCRTRKSQPGADIGRIKYDLIRRAFDKSSGLFGSAEIVFNASEKNKSVSFPSVSPDGNYLILTLQDHGTFPIWHKEADLYLLDLKTMKAERLDLNSDETESYHSWSSNGRWLVFSSKRGDGLTARPYFAYFGSPDNIGKPFVLPQKDPALYKRLAKTFNRPEFVSGKIKIGPRDFSRASGKEPVKATWIDAAR